MAHSGITEVRDTRSVWLLNGLGAGVQVARSLWGPDTRTGEMLAPVTVKYRRLKKGSR